MPDHLKPPDWLQATYVSAVVPVSWELLGGKPRPAGARPDWLPEWAEPVWGERYPVSGSIRFPRAGEGPAEAVEPVEWDYPPGLTSDTGRRHGPHLPPGWRTTLWAEVRAAAAAWSDHLVAVVDLHKPTIGRLAECQGCDWGGYDGEAPPWPCRTVELIADRLHVHLRGI